MRSSLIYLFGKPNVDEIHWIPTLTGLVRLQKVKNLGYFLVTVGGLDVCCCHHHKYKKYIIQNVASEVLASYTCNTLFPRIEPCLTESKRITSPDDGVHIQKAHEGDSQLSSNPSPLHGV